MNLVNAISSVIIGAVCGAVFTISAVGQITQEPAENPADQQIIVYGD